MSSTTTSAKTVHHSSIHRSSPPTFSSYTKSSSSVTSFTCAVRSSSPSHLDIQHGVIIPSPLLHQIVSLHHHYYQLVILFYNNHSLSTATFLSTSTIACINDFCSCDRHGALSLPANYLCSAFATDLCQLLIDLYNLPALASRALVLDALCGCCRQGILVLSPSA